MRSMHMRAQHAADTARLLQWLVGDELRTLTSSQTLWAGNQRHRSKGSGLIVPTQFRLRSAAMKLALLALLAIATQASAHL